MPNLKNKILKNLQNTYCRAKPSKISGVGIFAIRDIPQGVDPFFGSPARHWAKFKMAELKSLDPEIIKMVDDFFVIEKDQTVYLPEHGLFDMDISFFINHSRQPNLKTKDGWNFLTARKIKKGEELTADYGEYDDKYK